MLSFRALRWVALALGVGALVVACGARTGLGERPVGDRCDADATTRPCKTVCGVGIETCTGGLWAGCTAPPPKPPAERIALTGTVRDLHDTHPDVEAPFDQIGDDRGIVAALLGSDEKPTYVGTLTTPTTHGSAAFASWYHDVPGVNQPTAFTIDLVRSSGLTYGFDSDSFFPIDGLLFGNEGRVHNYHFTFEVHSVFEYRGGETFTFTGDDDLWLFVNRHLVIDLGGVHSAESATVSLDQRAAELGIERGKLAAFDLFFAERHTSESTFHIQTTIAGFSPCP